MTKIKENIDPLLDIIENHVPKKELVVFNDDVNTFDFVIATLVIVCNHNALQATQCAHIIHNNGKCSVRTGEYSELEPMCSALLEYGLTAEIQ